MVAVFLNAGAGWDSRLYSLELLGFLFVFHGVGLAAACRRLLAGDGEALRPARLACGWILGLAVPLVPIQAGAVVPAAAALVGIAALTACYSRI